jgi:hypothetical protein
MPIEPDTNDIDDRRLHLRDDTSRRREARSRTILPGMVLFHGEEISRPVVILNRSAQGAKLRFADAGILPSTFALVDQRAGLAHMCRIVWKDIPLVGVRFEQTLDVKQDDERLASRLRSLWQARAD